MQVISVIQQELGGNESLKLINIARQTTEETTRSLNVICVSLSVGQYQKYLVEDCVWLDN